jgi:hypothetical protein
MGVVAGLVPAISNLKTQSKYNRGGRDKPGHDRGRWCSNLTGIRPTNARATFAD